MNNSDLTFASYFKWIKASLALGLVLPLIVGACALVILSERADSSVNLWQWCWIPVCLGYLVWYGISKFQKLAPLLQNQTELQDVFVRQLSPAKAAWGIIIVAALSLFLELILIRWQSCLFEFFSFFKNFGLLACFCGLGTGYAIASRKTLPIVCMPFLVTFQIAIMSILKYGMGRWLSAGLQSIPVTESWFMGVPKTTVATYFSTYSLLIVTFVLTAMALLPVGQLCGQLMERLTPLRSYGYNLAGSFLGIGLCMLLTGLWTPPAVWFALAFTLTVICSSYTRGSTIAVALCSLFAIGILDWPVDFGAHRVYSPYQLLELQPGDRGVSSLIAAGTYYQRMLDLAPESQLAFPDRRWRARYYELPFRLAPALDSVAVIGAGTGNDIAAALRCGAKHIRAIEIDPAIKAIGTLYHPELPYSDKRVQVTVNDGRAFLHNTNEKFDAIVFGLVDSHTLSSQATSLRVDSYIYTVDALKEARAKLKDNGIISLAFAVPTVEVAKKLYNMMQLAFDGNPPVCLTGVYDDSFLFVQSKDGKITIPDIVKNDKDFKDYAGTLQAMTENIEVSTDDWPFFYMIKRQFPVSYIYMILIVLALSFAFVYSFNRERPQASGIVFFLLGAGFMLLETKAITELGLHMGNTFFVISAVIATIMAMAFISNLIVQRIKIQSTLLPYILLIASIGLSWALAGQALPGLAAPLSASIVLTFPIIFSGIVFSRLLSRTHNIGAAMGMNIFGAMCGGVLEYCAMFAGYKMLYLMAIVIYGLAFAGTHLMGGSKETSN